MKKAYDEHGYIILRNVFDEDVLSPIRSLTDEIFAAAEKRVKDPFVPYLMSHRSDQGVLYDLYERFIEFRRLIEHDRVLDALEAVVGENFFLYENSLITKPRGKRNGVPWHQDFISRTKEPLKTIVWMALDDVRVENGTVRIIPGSHREGFLPWYRVEGETHHDRVKPEYVDEEKAQFVEMNAGDVLIFNMLLLHGSEEVHSDLPRRAYRCSIQSMDDQIYSPRGIPVALRGGRPAFMEERMRRLSPVQ